MLVLGFFFFFTMVHSKENVSHLHLIYACMNVCTYIIPGYLRPIGSLFCRTLTETQLVTKVESIGFLWFRVAT